MKFDIDIFISYAHIDNESIKVDDKGWIANFHRALEVRVFQILGEKPVIWRDKKLQGNDLFSDEIINQFSKTALLISIVSPRYIKSEWCTKEVNTFHETIKQNQTDVIVGNKSRIFKVVKTPISVDNYPPIMKDVLGYEFFIIDSETGRARELNQKDKDLSKTYWTRLDDLAYDIVDMLGRLKKMENVPFENELSSDTETPDEHTTDQTTVYLAQTSYDMSEQLKSLRRELIQHDIRVLPEVELPLTEANHKEIVSEMLDQSDISVHLVGEGYGMIPEEGEESIVVIQNKLAIQKSKENKLKRVIWLPPDIKSTNERQSEFINKVKIDAETQYGADILETTLEDLKHAVHDKIIQHKENKIKSDTAEKEANELDITDEVPKQIYLICDQKDLDNTIALEDFLFEQGFDIIFPAFEGDEAKVRIDHQENLKLCDATIIYYGEGSDLWARSKTRDIMKIAGYGRKTPLHTKAVFLAAPQTKQKERFRTQGSLVINGMDGFAPQAMEAFVNQLKH